MLKILFVCLGNICRSPMGEFIFKDLIEKQGLADRFFVASAGTSAEEEGNPVYPPARETLRRHGIACAGKRAVQFRAQDYGRFDFILAMEERNAESLRRTVGADPRKKIVRLLDFSPRPRDISDPWYTRDFEAAYNDIAEGANCFLQWLRAQGLV